MKTLAIVLTALSMLSCTLIDSVNSQDNSQLVCSVLNPRTGEQIIVKDQLVNVSISVSVDVIVNDDNTSYVSDNVPDIEAVVGDIITIRFQIENLNDEVKSSKMSLLLFDTSVNYSFSPTGGYEYSYEVGSVPAGKYPVECKGTYSLKGFYKRYPKIDFLVKVH